MFTFIVHRIDHKAETFGAIAFEGVFNLNTSHEQINSYCNQLVNNNRDTIGKYSLTIINKYKTEHNQYEITKIYMNGEYQDTFINPVPSLPEL